MTRTSTGLIVGPGEGRLIKVPGTPMWSKASTRDTKRAYALIESLVEPKGGPPQHIHTMEDEAFYVLHGQVTVKIGDEVTICETGSLAFAPRGTAHTFWNAGETPAKLLILITPSGLEGMFIEAAGDQEIDKQTYITRAMAISPSYGIEIVGPPLG